MREKLWGNKSSFELSYLMTTARKSDAKSDDDSLEASLPEVQSRLDFMQTVRNSVPIRS